MNIKFNRTKIGTSANYIELESNIKAKSKVTSRISSSFELSANVRAKSKVISNYERVQECVSKTIVKSKQNSNYVKVQFTNATLKSSSKQTANYNAYEIKEVNLSNLSFEPSDVIEIDFENYTITKNKENILDKFEGDFFKLAPGENTIIYTDDAEERKVFVQSTHTNYYL